MLKESLRTYRTDLNNINKWRLICPGKHRERSVSGWLKGYKQNTLYTGQHMYVNCFLTLPNRLQQTIVNLILLFSRYLLTPVFARPTVLHQFKLLVIVVNDFGHINWACQQFKYLQKKTKVYKNTCIFEHSYCLCI